MQYGYRGDDDRLVHEPQAVGMDSECHAIATFSRSTHSCIDSHYPYTPRVPRVYLRRLGSNIKAVIGLSAL